MGTFSFGHIFIIKIRNNFADYASDFPLVATSLSIFSLAIVGIALLLLGVFISHSGEFTRFLHRLGSVYLIYYV